MKDFAPSVTFNSVQVVFKAEGKTSAIAQKYRTPSSPTLFLSLLTRFAPPALYRKTLARWSGGVQSRDLIAAAVRRLGGS